jgi:feruloyl esterase
MAKSAIQIAYGKGPDRSYLGGCSNGGRHTLVGAARYSDQYDGFLAGAPGYNLPKAAVRSIYRGQQYASLVSSGTDPSTPAGLGTAYTAAERSLLAQSVLAKCDALDGVSDGLVQDTGPARRRSTSPPTCPAAAPGATAAARRRPRRRRWPISSRARAPARAPRSTTASFDGGHGGGVAFWSSPRRCSSTRARWACLQARRRPPASTAFALSANIDTLVAQINASNSTYTESGMSFMTPPHPSDLSALKNRGAKVMIYHGVSDPIFSVNDTQDLIEGLNSANGGDAGNFARLFRVPGMNHCSGGPSTDQFDMLGPLVAWVEQGGARAGAGHGARRGQCRRREPRRARGWSPKRSRPLCVYPKVARYKGSGDIESAASFSCQP